MSGHPRWPGFNTKTGNPVVDNANRRLNKSMYQSTRETIKFTGYKNRKRKKALWRIEGGNYIKLWAAIMQQIAAEASLKKGQQ